MLRALKNVLIFFMLFSSVLATASDLEFKLLNSGKKEVDTGVSINVLVMITNYTDTDKDIQIRLTNGADSCKLIADYSSICIKKGTSLNKIIGIQIPNYFRSGDYTIVLEALEKAGINSFGIIEIPIYIKPTYEISITKLNTPQFIFAGDSMRTDYLIRNLSNLDATIKTTAINGSQTKVNHLIIPRDSGVIVSHRVSTSKKSTSYSRQTIIFIATIVDKPETETSVSSSIDVFPSGNVKFDKFERFPVKVAGIAASSNRFGDKMISGLFDIRGQGELGKMKDKTLSFHLRGPDRSGDPLFGLNDEYYLLYSTPKLKVTLGDYNFGLSDLTEASRSGRGVELQYKIKKLSVGSYFNTPRYYPLVKQIYAAYTNYDFNTKNGISAGYLVKSDTTNQQMQLFTLSAFITPFPWMKTSAEVAAGEKQSERTKAYKASLALNFSPVSAHINYLYADPNFPGFISNSLRLSSAVSLQLNKFILSASYDQNSTYMALDTLYANMPFSKNLSLSTSYRFTPQNTISLGGYSISLKDQSINPLFDYTRTYGRLSMQNRFGSFSLTLLGDYGIMENLLSTSENKQSIFYNGTFSFNYRLSKRLSTSIYTNYQGGQQNVTGYDRFYYGGMLSGNIKDRFSVSLQYNSNYEWQYYNSDRSLFSLNLNGHINANNEISLSANYNLIKNSLDTKEYNVQLRYTHTINIPVSKKKNLGSVTGKIINHGVEKVSGLRINMGGSATITDKDGNFKFPMLPVGSHILGIDVSNLELNTITEIPGPILIAVEPGKIIHYEIALTKSGSIAGHIVIQEDERAGQKGFIPVKEQIDKLIIEANNGSEVFRIYTNRDGTFRFEDLRPGNWQVKVYPKGLPLGYQLITGTFNIALSSGEDEKIDIMIKKKARQIQFQTTLK